MRARAATTIFALPLAGAALLAGAFSPAVAGTVAHPAVVSADPVNFTPNIVDGTVKAVAVVGTKIIVGGTFTGVRNAGSSTTLARNKIFAFDRTTGLVDTAFVPSVNNQVTALVAGDNGTVYAGGYFSTVNGVAQRGVAHLSVATGARVSAFGSTSINWGSVRAMARRGGQLYIAGNFGAVRGVTRTHLARLDATTGAVDPNFNFTVSHPRAGETPIIGHLAVDPANTRLIIDGTFTQVNGQRRYQIAKINTATVPATLSSWATERYSAPCNTTAFWTYTRGIDFAPDGSYFVVVTTGGPYGTSTLCDTAARWEAAATGPNQNPTWVNWTGGDSLYAVAVTGPAVYVGGHQRWLDNPQGSDSAGPGAVSRPGIGAIHPVTGKAVDIPWNPGKTLGHGVETILGYDGGIIVGSDGDFCRGEFHGKLCIWPLP